MRNRAKCKLCKDIIESFHRTDTVFCKCNEISIAGGEDEFKCAANKWDNFLRIDDQGNEIEVKVEVKDDVKPLYIPIHNRPSKQELVKELEQLIKNIENLPEHAMYTQVTQYDLYSSLMLVLAIFKSDVDSCKDDICDIKESN